MFVFAFIVILALMIPLIAVVLDSQLGRALAGRLERSAPVDESLLAPRVQALEGDVERLTAELQQLQEQSQFLHQLLESKSAAGQLPPGDPQH
jgi:hypothetical protein